MSNELAVYEQPRTPADRYRFALSLADARTLPGELRGSVADVLLRIEYGIAVGIPPISALSAIHVVDGKPTASAGLMSALIRGAGHRLRIGTRPDERHPGEVVAFAELVRKDDPDFVYRVEWDVERAAAAGLVTIDERTGKVTAAKSKSAWSTYRPAMLKARAISEIARDACEDVLLGVHYTPEELGAPVNESGDVIDGEVVPTPPRAPEPPPAAPPAANRPDPRPEPAGSPYAAARPTPPTDPPAVDVDALRSEILAAAETGGEAGLRALWKRLAHEHDGSEALETLLRNAQTANALGETCSLFDVFSAAVRFVRQAGQDGDGEGQDGGSEGGGGSTPPPTPSAPRNPASGARRPADEPDPWQTPGPDAHPDDLPSPTDPEPGPRTGAAAAIAALGGTVVEERTSTRQERAAAAAQTPPPARPVQRRASPDAIAAAREALADTLRR